MTNAGVLPVDKPTGPTSHDIVARARRALGLRAIGHTGTLDPFASGLLLLCIAGATRIAEYLTGLDKRYTTTVRLGQRTDTDDRCGVVLSEDSHWRSLSGAGVLEALAQFRGGIQQTPPAYSAKKIGGERAHARARRGETVELRPVGVRIHELNVIRFDPPLLELAVHCSSGTYVRALARDLGVALGTGAHLTELRRLQVGPHHVHSSVAVEEMEQASRVTESLLSPLSALSHLPCIQLDEEGVRRIRHGQALPGVGSVEGEQVALARGQELIAVAAVSAGVARPSKVFAW